MSGPDVPCPQCGANALRIEMRTRIVTKPIGSFSLAGTQMKFSAWRVKWPWLVCGNCGIEAEAKEEES